MINKLELLWVSYFIALEIYFLNGAKFPWNKGIDTYALMSNVCYFAVILIFLVVT